MKEFQTFGATTNVRNKSGGSSSEWVWEAGRKQDVKFSLGHFEVPVEPLKRPVGN